MECYLRLVILKPILSSICAKVKVLLLKKRSQTGGLRFTKVIPCSASMASTRRKKEGFITDFDVKAVAVVFLGNSLCEEHLARGELATSQVVTLNSWFRCQWRSVDKNVQLIGVPGTKQHRA